MVLGLSALAITNLTWLAIIFLTTSVSFTVWYMKRVNYPFLAIIHADSTGSKLSPINKMDRAKLVKVYDSGERLYWLRKGKHYIAGMGLLSGVNTISWYFNREDGYYYNMVYTDFNMAMMQMGVKSTDKNIRMANAQGRKAIEQYRPKGFSQWLVPIAVGVLIIISAINGYSLYKTSQVTNNGIEVLAQSQKSSDEHNDKNTEIIANAVATLVEANSGLKRP